MVEHGGARDREGQAGIVGLGVVVLESGGQALATERWHVADGVVHRDPVVALADAHAARQVVHPERRIQGLGDGLPPVERDEERQRLDQVGGVVEEALALAQSLVDEAVVALVEVAQPAVHHLGRFRGRA